MDDKKPEDLRSKDPVYRPQPINGTRTGLTTQKKSRKWIKQSILGLIGLILLAAVSVSIWFFTQLSPVNPDDESRHLIKITPGSTPSVISKQLEDAGIIKSSLAFEIYARITNNHGKLQAGSYRLSASETVQRIVRRMTSGDVDPFHITLYPGATLVDNTNVSDDKKMDFTTVLKRAGYTSEEIEAALNADYSSHNEKLFQGRPEGADLEGYIYGETYSLSSGSRAEDVVRMSLGEFWRVIQRNNLVAKFKDQGLTLYEGITLASIIQREASASGDDMPQIAQVFYSRLKIGMQLGSDVTYQYIADKTGVPRDTNLDSPYNTRRYTGLPPGPISSPGEKALLAAANPADGDYMYFLSGDDDVTYFARTFAEHEANRSKYCTQKCQIL